MGKFLQVATAVAVYALALLIATPSKAADAKDSKATASGDSDKVDLKKLEEKYWAAKDTDYSVIQNRAFPKEKRFFGSFSYGPLMNDSYSIGRMTNLALGYYYSEKLGVELNLQRGTLSDNDGVSKYRDQYGVQVDYNKFVESKSLMAVFVPMYAKMSFLDKAILYFDLQVSLGLGQVTYEMQKNTGHEQGSSTSIHFDITQQIFFHRHIAFRFDIKNTFYSQQRRRYQLTGGQTEANDRDLGPSRAHDTVVLLGITGFFP